ncbi:MAG: DMT family transporter [Candidatus Moduliflexus flocculans]|nr:DMT family transporter [Candidatus Moduliflexus flocculans]
MSFRGSRIDAVPRKGFARRDGPPRRTRWRRAVTNPPPSSAHRRTRVALLALVLFWGVNFSLVKLALRDLTPLAFTSLRFLLASGVLRVFLKAGGDRVRIDRLHWPAVIGLGLAGTTVYQVLFIYGIAWTLAGNASLIPATTPVFTTMLSLIFRQERSSPTAVFGVGLSVLGIALVVLGGTAGRELRRRNPERRPGRACGGHGLVGVHGRLGSPGAPVRRRPGDRRDHVGRNRRLADGVSAGAFGARLGSRPRHLVACGPGTAGHFAIATAYFLWYFCIRQIGSTRTAVYTNFTPVVASACCLAGAGGSANRASGRRRRRDHPRVRSWCAPARSSAYSSGR